jgi:hypothetical protein
MSNQAKCGDTALNNAGSYSLRSALFQDGHLLESETMTLAR